MICPLTMAKNLKHLPVSLDESMNELELDYQFLLEEMYSMKTLSEHGLIIKGQTRYNC